MEVFAVQQTHKSVSKTTSIFLRENGSGNHFRFSEGLGATNIVAKESLIIHPLSRPAMQTIAKIQSFASLGTNWDNYGALSPSEVAIEQAKQFVRELDKKGILVYFTAPGPNGEILLELKNAKKAAEIYFYPDEPADFILFYNEEENKEALLMEEKNHLFTFMQ